MGPQQPTRGAVMGPKVVTVACADSFGVTYVLIRVHIGGKGLLVLLDTGCEVDMMIKLQRGDAVSQCTQWSSFFGYVSPMAERTWQSKTLWA